jgi:hypothetical protein
MLNIIILAKVQGPELFTTPSPNPLADFDLSSTEPLLYRPFRHGPNRVTMGIRKLDWDNWIEMDSNFLHYHDLKVSELEKDLGAHVQYVNNAVTQDACFEVLEELTKYLTGRYPKIFQVDDKALRNTLTGQKFNYPARKESPIPCPMSMAWARLTTPATPTEALTTAAKLVQDDLVIMVENNDELSM